MSKFKVLTIFIAVIAAAMLFTGCDSNDPEQQALFNQAIGSLNASKTQTAPNATITSDEEDTDGYEEGTSPTDNIVNTTAAEKVILVASFGTSYNQSRSLTIGGIETAIKNAYPEYQVRRAFTSQIIIDKLAKREGLKIDNVTEAMDRLVLDNV
jgi:sirohydrochlorin cobaltochelatase